MKKRFIVLNLNVKTAIFCFDEMYEPLQQEVVEEILNADIYCLLKAWLIELVRQNIRYQQMFSAVEFNESFVS